MVRKSICAVLALFLLLSGVPHAQAASHTSHPACGTSCSHETTHTSLSATSWSSGYTLSGDRYLTSSQTVSRKVYVSGTARLCLNGNTLTFAEGYGLRVQEGASLEICNCKTTGGIVRGARESNSDSSIITNYGSLTIYGGNYCTDGEGVGLYNSETGTLTIYGGTFGIELSNYGTATIHSAVFDIPKPNYSPYPEAIYNADKSTLTVHDGTFRAYGNALRNLGTATIHGGTFQALRNDNIGCDCIDNKGKLDIYGGTISAVNGDGINNEYDSSYSKGLLSIYGGTITAAAANRAAVYNRDYLYVYGGTLSGYMGIYNGSAVTYVNTTPKDGGTCKVTGGTITGTLCGIRNSGTGSTSSNISRGILTIEKKPSISSILLEYPKALTFQYTGTTPVPIGVDLDYIKEGDVLCTNSSSYLQKMTMVTEGYVLLRGTYPNSSSDIVLATDACGADGDNLRWKLSQDGVLTIYGTGNMQNFSVSSNQPWNYSKTNIYVKQVVLEPGVTSVGSAAFSYLDQLTELTIPEGVTLLGSWCLEGLTNLAVLNIPSTVSTIGSLFASWTVPTALETITYNGCSHQWAKVAIASNCAPFTPTFKENTNQDDGNCLTALYCSVCGGVDAAAREAHTGGTATCTALAQCEVCGTLYGDYGHDHGYQWEEGTLIHGCSRCGDGRTVYLTVSRGATDGILTASGEIPAEMTVYAAAYDSAGRMINLAVVTPGQTISFPDADTVRLFALDEMFVPMTAGSGTL